MSSLGMNELGLLELEGPDDASVDIVFIHGVAGDRVQTWTRKHGVFWPKDLLPKDIPSARVWTWGHDADFFRLLSSEQA